MQTITIRHQSQKLKDGYLKLSVAVNSAQHDQSELFYIVPERWKDTITERLDPFVIAVLSTAMKSKSDLIIDGMVSKSLIRNLFQYMELMHSWYPDFYSLVDISASHLVDDSMCTQSSDNALCTFSGGVDSCFTAYRHTSILDKKNSYNITAGLLISGHDIRYQNKIGFDRTSALTHELLESIGLENITVITNMREYSGRRWFMCAGAGIASCLMLFGAGFRYGINASDAGIHTLFIPHTFSPVTGPLLSSNEFTNLHDGGAQSRLDKIRLISAWPEAMRLLRVCWKTGGEFTDRNCCICAKCIRTILAFRVLGIPAPKSLPDNISDEQIAEMNIGDIQNTGKIQIQDMQFIYDKAKQENITESWVSALGIAISNNQNHLNSLRYD